MDTPPDDEGGKWLSYKEIAVVRGISRASAERLVRRRRWRRLPDNHGVVRAYVPPEWTEPAEMRPPVYHWDSIPDTPPDNGPDTPPDITPTVRAFETALAEVKAAKDEQIITLRGDLAKERGRIAELISQIGDLESRLHHESRVAKEALEVADQLRQAEAERRGQGRWARLKAAWRGK